MNYLLGGGGGGGALKNYSPGCMLFPVH